MAKRIVVILEEHRGYWAWVNSETDLLRARHDLCLNCCGVGCGEHGGCPHEQALMQICREDDVHLAVSRCPAFRAGNKSRLRPVKETHHGRVVLVSPGVEAVRRDQCLCLNCGKCRPGSRDHCHIARRLYAICVAGDLAMIITRCPEFETKK